VEETKGSSAQPTPQGHVAVVRKPYRAPALVCYGRIQDLTAGMGMKGGDTGGKSMV
jgi:hypothetical protein